ncbi:hypothetical protein ACNVED_03220 [Legionella sp. D16C41]|uniref:hypothetical protein n=1 Tax=Legionella sp. D16C41 TaxID=3402688 RepID=UPI003AF4942D
MANSTRNILAGLNSRAVNSVTLEEVIGELPFDKKTEANKSTSSSLAEIVKKSLANKDHFDLTPNS